MSDANANQAQKNAPTDPIEARQFKLKAIRDAGFDPYPYTFPRSHQAGALQDQYAELENGVETTDKVAVAGRIMAMRNNGLFIDLMDASGKIQVFSHKDSMPADQLAKLDFLDIGDIVGATGTIRRTPRGELSVRALTIDVLTKSTLPLPEKYHGLSDVEQRYRQRYLDLIMNEDSRNRLRTRSRIVSSIRRYMDDMGAMEVETPMMHPIMGGASAKPFVTHHNALDTDFFLRVAPELYLKRLLVGGFADGVYEINRCFRNEGLSIKHNPEFTTIEGYHLYKDYNDMMDLVENLVRSVAMEVHGTTTVKFGDKEIDFGSPWRRATMADLVKEETGLDFMAVDTADQAHKLAQSIGLKPDPKMKWGQVLEYVFGERVEATLIQPTHVMDHPMDISPLAKTHRHNPRLVERFESFANGWEIANAFTELNDPAVQLERFSDQVAAREAGDDEAQMLDDDFIIALSYGLPPCGGWGMGIDRLSMLLTDAANIREVINFPTLKPIKS
jgi:lysyl-tRNA synthetase class 2